MEKLMIDSDVLINWLVKEKENKTNRKLWVAPAAILELGAMEQLQNHVSLLSVFEIRFVLRRKKRKDTEEIERDLNRMGRILQIETPTQDVLQEADQLQSKHPLDPFDGVLLAQAMSIKATLISRDNRFLEIAGRYTSSLSPEAYLENILDSHS